MFSPKEIKFILQSQHYHAVCIVVDKLETMTSFIEENLDSFQRLDEFALMLPSIYELNNSKEDLLFKFSPILKSFAEENQKRTLITCDIVLDSLLKEEKRDNFFKFLFRKKKNIIIFSTKNYLEQISVSNIELLHKVISTQEWDDNLQTFKRFEIIKNFTVQAASIFKEPFNQSNQM